jgi:hypothetical protein
MSIASHDILRSLPGKGPQVGEDLTVTPHAEHPWATSHAKRPG